MSIVNFVINFGACMNILSIVKVKSIWVIKWLYKPPPQLCWLLRLEWPIKVEHVVQILINMCLFGVPFLDPHLTNHHSNIGVRLRWGTKLGTSILVHRTTFSIRHRLVIYLETSTTSYDFYKNLRNFNSMAILGCWINTEIVSSRQQS